MNFRNFLLTGVLLAFLPISVVAGERDERSSALADRGTGGAFALTYGLGDVSGISGLQFDVKYDADALEVADTSNCLADLQDSHVGEFSVCNDIPEKSMVRVVVLDLGNNRELNSSSELGWIEFQPKGSNRQSVKSGTGRKAPQISNLVLADLEGDRIADSETERRSTAVHSDLVKLR